MACSLSDVDWLGVAVGMVSCYMRKSPHFREDFSFAVGLVIIGAVFPTPSRGPSDRTPLSMANLGLHAPGCDMTRLWRCRSKRQTVRKILAQSALGFGQISRFRSEG